MFGSSLEDKVAAIIEQAGPITVREIMDELGLSYRDPKERESINSLLYGQMRVRVVRDKNEDGMHTWRMKQGEFEAAKGLEVLFAKELLEKNIVQESEMRLDRTVENRKSHKVYHLDIAIEKDDKKYNIEIDGFEHLRADAMSSIGSQIAQNPDKEIAIDWMDHERSYVRFDQFDRTAVYKWCNAHPSWCMRYHEELIWPHDISRNIWLIESGWRIIRFWNFEVVNELERCLEDTQKFLKTI